MALEYYLMGELPTKQTTIKGHLEGAAPAEAAPDGTKYFDADTGIEWTRFNGAWTRGLGGLSVREIDLSEVSEPPEDVAVGDFFRVTVGGTLNGVTYASPDDDGNSEGFIINGTTPLAITPCHFKPVIRESVQEYANSAAFPVSGESDTIYIDKAAGASYFWDGAAYVALGGTLATWGTVTGVLSAQSDLWGVLAGKFNNPLGGAGDYLDGAGAVKPFPAVLPEAPIDGKTYGRKNAAWSEVTPPKPIDLRPQPGPVTLSVDESSTVTPTITSLTYSAVFDDTDQVCAVDIECEGGKGFWVAWKPTEANDTFVSIAPNIVGVGQFVMAYVEGTGLIAVADSSVIDPDFSVGDTLLLGIREDGQIFLGTDNVAVFDSPLSPTTVDSFMVGASSASATASFSCDVIVDKDLLPSSLKSVVTAEDLPAIYKLYPAWPPAEPVSVGDTFYVTHGGTFNGLTYSNPDANNNHEGFIVDELLPELKVTPFIKGSGGGSYLGDVTKSVGGGGDFADYDELQDWMDVNAGNIITVNVIGDVTTKADPLRAYNNKNWSFIKIKNTTSSYYKLPGGFGYVGCNFGVSIAGKFELQSAMQTINRAADGEAPYILELQGGFFYQQVHSDYVKTISDGILSAQDSVVISLETTKNVNLTNSRVLDYIKCLSDTASVALFGSNTIEKIDANDKTISTLIGLLGYSGTTQTSVGQIINDSNVTDIIESGKTINSFNNWGFVTVGNST